MYSTTVNDGYYRKHVTYDECLKYCPHGSAGVIKRNNGGLVLVSYTTPVIYIDADGWLECTGTYIATTRKHIGAFMREYTPVSYYTAKDCYERKQRINLWNGRIEKL